MTTLREHGFSTTHGLNRYIIFNERGTPFYVTKGRNPHRSYLLAAINGCHIADVFQETFTEKTVEQKVAPPSGVTQSLTGVTQSLTRTQPTEKEVEVSETFVPKMKKNIHTKFNSRRTTRKVVSKKWRKSIHHPKLEYPSDEDTTGEDDFFFSVDCPFGVNCMCYECKFERFKLQYA